MKKEVNVWDYAGHIMQTIPKGCLLTTSAEGHVNTMVIGWGHIGVIWGKPVFVAYVRESRHTKSLVEKNGEFTVNTPLAPIDKNIIAVCGTKSGRDLDKFAELGLETEDGLTVSVPGIRQLPLTLECKVIYKQKQDLSAIPEGVLQRYYPADESGFQDYHYVYYGQIVNSYLITE